ncbi:MAG: rhodanese-like domain-containing protein [Arenicellales bacterium]
MGLCLCGFSIISLAFDAKDLTKTWQHTPFELYLDAQEAFDLKTQNSESVLLIDVRNRPEIHYIGMADAVDANIPYRLDSVEWKLKKHGQYGSFIKPKNPNFTQGVENLLKAKGLDKNSPIIIMCTSGSRAPFAAKALHKAGFKKVYTQVEGFEGIKAESGEDKGKRVVNGWKNRGLPWRYELPPEKMYFNFMP